MLKYHCEDELYELVLFMFFSKHKGFSYQAFQMKWSFYYEETISSLIYSNMKRGTPLKVS